MTMELQLSPPHPSDPPPWPDEEREDTVPPVAPGPTCWPCDDPEPAPDAEPDLPVNG